MSESTEILGGVIDPTAVSTTAGDIIVQTNGNSVVVFELSNDGAVDLNSCSLYRRAFPGMTWELLNDSIGDYAAADPQVKAYAVAADDSDTSADPTSLAAGARCKIYCPVDGNQHVRLTMTTAADDTTVSGAYGLGSI